MTTLYGDANEEGVFDGRVQSQLLEGDSGIGIENHLYGEAFELNNVRSRHDELIGGYKAAYNHLYGDANTLNNGSFGGNDVLTGGADAISNFLYGDSYLMVASSGGNDVLTGGAGASNNALYGDSASMQASSGGNDVLTVETGANDNYLFGDANYLEFSSGGNDVLAGGAGANYNYLYGDSLDMEASSGGNDLLIAGADRDSDAYTTENEMFGDAFRVFQTDSLVTCGHDYLVSGTGSDAMWGDFKVISDLSYFVVDRDPALIITGRDVFVFSADNGTDTIYDFRRGEDTIELQGISGVNSFEDLLDKLSFSATQTVIAFSPDDSITLVGVSELGASDFEFA